MTTSDEPASTPPLHPAEPADQPASHDGTDASSTSAGASAGPRDARAGSAPQEDAPVVRAMDVADPSTVRRAPRYGRFAFLGFVVGALLALVLTFVGSSQFSDRDVFFVLLMVLGLAGIFAGLGWALISDRRSMRRRR